MRIQFPPGRPLCAVCGKTVDSFGYQGKIGNVVGRPHSFIVRCHGAAEITYLYDETLQDPNLRIGWATAFAEDVTV